MPRGSDEGSLAVGLQSRIASRYRRTGLWHVLYEMGQVSLQEIRNTTIALVLNILPPRTFSFEGQELTYLSHRYNTTWINERAIEVPIAMSFLRKYAGRAILEIGNTINHYFPFPHDVVDKYEKAAGVLNEDVVDLRPQKRYELIISISTLEHVGFDEEPRDPAKVLRAFDNLVENCLAPSGHIAVTMPIGYNPAVDRFLEQGRISFTEEYFFRRLSKDNEWRQVLRAEAFAVKRAQAIPGIASIIVGVLKR